jgi:hypothetical protein
MPTNREKGVSLMVIRYIFRNHPYVRTYVGQPVSSSPETVLQTCVLVKEMTYFRSRLILYSTKLLGKLIKAQGDKKVSAWYGIRWITTILTTAHHWPLSDHDHSNPEPPIQVIWIFLNTVFEFTPCFSKLFLLFRFTYQNSPCISLHAHLCPKLRPCRYP